MAETDSWEAYDDGPRGCTGVWRSRLLFLGMEVSRLK